MVAVITAGCLWPLAPRLDFRPGVQSDPEGLLGTGMGSQALLSLARSSVLAIGAICATPSYSGANACNSDAMIVFDGSGSMSEMGFNLLDEPRIFGARKAIRDTVPEISRTRDLGLIIYGPGSGDGCSNVDLRFAPVADAADRIISEVEALVPVGNTPLSDSVGLAARVLDYRSRPGVVVLITDGKETCGGAPCQLAAELSREGADLTVHVIGFQVRGDHFSYPNQASGDYVRGRTVARCLADITGGEYFSTETVDELVAALRVALGCPSVS